MQSYLFFLNFLYKSRSDTTYRLFYHRFSFTALVYIRFCHPRTCRFFWGYYGFCLLLFPFQSQIQVLLRAPLLTNHYTGSGTDRLARKLLCEQMQYGILYLHKASVNSFNSAISSSAILMQPFVLDSSTWLLPPCKCMPSRPQPSPST